MSTAVEPARGPARRRLVDASQGGENATKTRPLVQRGVERGPFGFRSAGAVRSGVRAVEVARRRSRPRTRVRGRSRRLLRGPREPPAWVRRRRPPRRRTKARAARPSRSSHRRSNRPGGDHGRSKAAHHRHSRSRSPRSSSAPLPGRPRTPGQECASRSSTWTSTPRGRGRADAGKVEAALDSRRGTRG